MKRRFKRWLGITLLLKRIVVLELAAKEAKQRHECQMKLIEGLEARIAELEESRKLVAVERPKSPRVAKTWSEVQRILERGEDIHAVR